MAWNQPGGGGGDRDPWGGRNGQQGPPDLDEVLRKIQGRLSGLFGKGGQGRSSGGGGAGVGFAGPGGKGIAVIVVVVALAWLLAGIYIVEPAEEGVVLRFGKFHQTTIPGPHWAPYLIDKVETVNVEQVRRAEIGFRSETGGQGIATESLMLTKDENIVDLKFVVLYRIKDAKDYLFRVRDPDTTLRHATESAVREVVGKTEMDFVLTQGRSQVASSVHELAQDIIDRYATGLLMTSVNMQAAQPPKQVQAAFSDAVKAREDEERVKNEARAYAADILPKARGDANAILERAQGYKQRVVSIAKGETSRFAQVLAQYQKAPDVTRERLYLDAIEGVMNNSSKILVDVDGGASLLYLPIDKLIESARAAGRGDTPSASSVEDAPRQPGFSESMRRERTGRSRAR